VVKSTPPAPRPSGDFQQFKFSLARDLYQRLSGSADEHHVSVGEEIRRRLEASFGVEVDQDTLKLAEAIKLAAPPGWRTNSRAFDILRQAIGGLLAQLKSAGDDIRNVGREERRYEAALLTGRALSVFGLPVRLGQFHEAQELGDEP
jgi:hypothetical protein